MVRFQLHIASLSLQAPLTIDSWTAVAAIGVAGTQSAAFRMTGSGGPVTPRQPITGDLYGSWRPDTSGMKRLRGGGVLITARIGRIGTLTARCLPNTPRPVIGSVLVVSPQFGRVG